MSTANPSPRPQSSTQGGTFAKKTGAGGSAGIEIVGFPQTLYTRTFGDPEMLFVPLLEAAREAFTVLERLASHGEERAAAVKLAGMQLASSLLS